MPVISFFEKNKKKIFIFGGLKNLTNLLPKCQLLSFFFPRITSLISDLNYLNLVGTSPLYFLGLLSPLSFSRFSLFSNDVTDYCLMR